MTGNPAMDALLEDLVAPKDQVCIASGRVIRDSNYFFCKACKHPMIIAESKGLVSCPLCHTALPPPGDKARQPLPTPGAKR